MHSSIGLFQRLPTSIGNLSRLRVLDLEENKLDSLPHEIGNAHETILLFSSLILHSK